jgi:hypothetical protein
MSMGPSGNGWKPANGNGYRVPAFFRAKPINGNGESRHEYYFGNISAYFPSDRACYAGAVSYPITDVYKVSRDFLDEVRQLGLGAAIKKYTPMGRNLNIIQEGLDIEILSGL